MKESEMEENEVRITRFLPQSDPFLSTVLETIKKDFPNAAYLKDNGLIKAVRKYAVYVTKDYYVYCIDEVLRKSRLKPAHKKTMGRYGNDTKVDARKELLI